MSSNYNLQAFTHGTVSADETHALVEYQGSWNDWDFAFVEGAGDGVLWERGTNDWKITKTANGYKAEKTNGFTTADTFQPDSNGIVTITFSWSNHTGLKFKPPVIGGTSTEGFSSGATGASGEIFHYGSSITWTIDADSPTAGNAHTYSLELDNTSYYPNGITHNTGTHTTVTIPTQVGTWKLWHQDENGYEELASLTVASVGGKRHCNFW